MSKRAGRVVRYPAIGNRAYGCLWQCLRVRGEMTVPNRKRVLFLCTGNSCRSQMAEAIVNARLGDRWQAFSAGVQPAGYVHPNVVRALAEIGIQHKGRSKSANEFRAAVFDLVVTVCDQAAEECPVWLGPGKRVHLGFPDPAKVVGGDAEVMAAFRTVRDEIAQRIPELLESTGASRIGSSPSS
jgi:arsenate reductase